MAKQEERELKDQEVQLTREVLEKLGRVRNLNMIVSAHLGETKMRIKDILALKPGSVIKLGKLAGDALDMKINSHKFAYGEIVIMNDKYGIRLTDVLNNDRLDKI